jgi:hypothetical protein
MKNKEYVHSDFIENYLNTLKNNSRYKGILINKPGDILTGKVSEKTYRKRYLEVMRGNPNWKRIITIINTKIEGESGKHWVVIYVDRTKKTPGISYFDSFAKPMNEDIKNTWDQFLSWNESTLFYQKVNTKGSPGRKSDEEGGRSPSRGRSPTKIRDILPFYINKNRKPHKNQKEFVECGILALWYAT